MKRDMTACEVKRAAMRIMMMPTGTLVFRPVRAEIHPLQATKPSFNFPPRIISSMQMHLLKVQCVKFVSICNFYRNTHNGNKGKSNLTHWTFKKPLVAYCMLGSPDWFSHLAPQPVMPTHWMT